MAQKSSVHSAFSEDPSLVHNTDDISSSQLSVTLATGNPTPSSDLQGHLHVNAHTITQTHIHTLI